MMIFRPGDFFFQRVHPMVLGFYMVTLFLIMIVSNHPILLSCILLITLLSAISVGGSEDIKKGFIFIVKMGLFYMAINCLINKNGGTLIWRGPNIPLFGRLQISVEVLVYSLVMGIRLCGIYILFIFFNKAMSPDSMLAYMTRFFPKSALLISMTTKTIPHLAQLAERIRQVMYVMGLNTDGHSRKDGIKGHIPILKVLFMSSMEDSLSIAESIQARGYGGGRRSQYFEYRWYLRDLIVMIPSIYGLIGVAMLYRTGGVTYNFYPRLDSLGDSIQNIGIFMSTVISLCIPAVMGWEWRYCKYLKYRI